MGAYSDGKEIIKDMIKLANGISDMELKSKILELQSQFFDLNDENRDLRSELHELKNIKLMDQDLEYHNGVYTKGKDVYCVVCWDKDKRLSRVRKVKKDPNNGTTAYSCDLCNKWRFSDIPFEEE